MLCSFCRNHHIKNSRAVGYTYLMKRTVWWRNVHFSKRIGKRKKSATHPVALPKHAQAWKLSLENAEKMATVLGHTCFRTMVRFNLFDEAAMPHSSLPVPCWRASNQSAFLKRRAPQSEKDIRSETLHLNSANVILFFCYSSKLTRLPPWKMPHRCGPGPPKRKFFRSARSDEGCYVATTVSLRRNSGSSRSRNNHFSPNQRWRSISEIFKGGLLTVRWELNSHVYAKFSHICWAWLRS